MLNIFSRRSSNRKVVASFYHRIAEAALRPELFVAYRIEDTLTCRFESLAVHMCVVLRHLRGWPAPAADVAGDLTDYYFTQLDDVLRALGTSDNKVPKKMKEMAGAFLKGAQGCDQALASGDAVAVQELLSARFGPEVDAVGFARYVYASDDAVRSSDLTRLLTQGPSFPVPPFPVGEQI